MNNSFIGKYGLKTLFFLVYFALISFSAYAERAGSIKFTSPGGKIQIISSKGKSIKTPQSGIVNIDYGDLVRSDSSAKVELSMLEGNYKIDIYPNTVYRVVKPEPKKNQILLFLGKALFNINKLARSVMGESFEVKGKFSTMGVKGTEFIAEETTKTSTLTVITGRVSFSSNNLPDEVVSVTELQKASVVGDKPPTAPVAVTKVEVNNNISSNSVSQGVVVTEETKQKKESKIDKVDKVDKVEKIDDIIRSINEENQRNADIGKSNAEIEIILTLP